MIVVVQQNSKTAIMKTTISLIVPMMMAATMQTPASDTSRTNRISNGWQRSVKVPPVKDENGEEVLRGAQLKLWVEDGWLLVRRETLDGNLEWQLVLARSESAPAPEVRLDESKGSFEITFKHYLVREGGGFLRAFRARKAPQSPSWPNVVPEARGTNLGRAGRDFTLSATEIGDWCWVGAGLKDGEKDLWLRLGHKGLRDPGFGFQGGPVTYFFYGNWNIQDDGDILVCARALEEGVEQALAAKKVRESMGKDPAPVLSTKQWFNVPDDVSPESLKGKVVLLDFWGQWCAPCVKRLPHSEELHQKFKDRGLVVIGIHSAQSNANVRTFLQKTKVTFPVAIDTGATAKRYAVEAWPTYFLIDKSGRVAWGFSNEAPKESEIERLLRSGDGPR